MNVTRQCSGISVNAILCVFNVLILNKNFGFQSKAKKQQTTTATTKVRKYLFIVLSLFFLASPKKKKQELIEKIELEKI